MGIYMGPIWATHKGLTRNLQHGSMLDPHGQSNVETTWVQYGKNQPTFTFQKKTNTTFTHFYTNDYVSSPSPFHGLVSSQMIEAYVHVQVIAHAYNQDALRL